MLSGQTDFAISTDTPFVYAAMRGLRPIVIAAYSRSTGGAVLVARIDRIKSPADFAGKAVATPTGGGGHYYLTRYLNYHKIALRDVKIINMSPADSVNALVRGDVDAVSWDRRASNTAVERGEGKIAIVDYADAPKYFHQHCLMLANEKAVKEKPETCRLVVRALKAGVDFARSNPDQVIEIVAKRTKTTPAETKMGVADFELIMNLDDPVVRDMVVQSEWAIENKLAERPAGVSDLTAFYKSHIYANAMRAEVPGGFSIMM
jgi:ABC-type nitrate/sulfonate/bicarbonate transport system substrate-binding protein